MFGAMSLSRKNSFGMKTLFLIISMVAIFVSGESVLRYGRLSKKNDCLLLFVVSDSGVNGTTDRGTCICSRYRDPRVDESGYGTQYVRAIRSLYTECTQVVPVRIDVKKRGVWERVDEWVNRECRRRKRMLHCNIISHLKPNANMTMSVYDNVYAIAPISMQAKLVDGLMTRGFTKK